MSSILPPHVVLLLGQQHCLPKEVHTTGGLVLDNFMGELSVVEVGTTAVLLI